MDEELNALTDVQEPVVEVLDPASEIDSEVEGILPDGEVAAPQSHEDNQAAKAARLQAENAANMKIAQLQAEQDEFAKGFGYSSYAELVEITTAQRMQVEADNRGVSVEEIKAQQAQAQEFERIRQENEALKNQMYRVHFDKDLSDIKAAFPTEKASKIEDLGEEFIKLRASGVSALVAYRVISEQKQSEKKPIPPSIGAVNEVSTKEKDFYTSEEVDKLSDKDLNNPKIMERVMKSMQKWGRR